MKIVSINGSPRRKGNTACVLDWVELALIDGGHKVHRVNITEKRVSGCVGCYKCQRKPGKLVCKFDDYAMKLFKRMENSDVIVYASPLYCWSFTSQLKAFIDRHLCLVTGYGKPESWKSRIEGKRVAMLLTAEGPEGPGNTDAVSLMFERLSAYTKTNMISGLIVPYCTTPDKLGDSHREQARLFAARLVA